VGSNNEATPRPRAIRRPAIPFIVLGGALLLAWALNQNVRVREQGPVDLEAFRATLEATRPALRGWGLMATSYNRTLGAYTLAFGPRLLTVPVPEIEQTFRELGRAWVRAGGAELAVYHYQTKRRLLRYSRERPEIVWEGLR